MMHFKEINHEGFLWQFSETIPYHHPSITAANWVGPPASKILMQSLSNPPQWTLWCHFYFHDSISSSKSSTKLKFLNLVLLCFINLLAPLKLTKPVLWKTYQQTADHAVWTKLWLPLICLVFVDCNWLHQIHDAFLWFVDYWALPWFEYSEKYHIQMNTCNCLFAKKLWLMQDREQQILHKNHRFLRIMMVMHI